MRQLNQEPESTDLERAAARDLLRMSLYIFTIGREIMSLFEEVKKCLLLSDLSRYPRSKILAYGSSFGYRSFLEIIK